MVLCSFTSRVAAYHDGELSIESARAVASHVEMCAQCSEELKSLRKVSGLLRQSDSEDLSPLELARLRLAIGAVENREDSPLRLFGGLLAVAASIMVVCAAWWYETPLPVPRASTSVHETPAWERTAMNRRVDLAPVSGGEGISDPNLAEWMVASLSNRENRREPTQN